MKQRGRKSEASGEFSEKVTRLADRRPEACPDWLDSKGKALWREIIGAHDSGFFGPADMPLLAEYCHTVASLIPRINAVVEADFGPKTLEARDKLVRQSLSQATRLRLCVSSRKRADTAEMRDAVKWSTPPWEAK